MNLFQRNQLAIIWLIDFIRDLLEFLIKIFEPSPKKLRTIAKKKLLEFFAWYINNVRNTSTIIPVNYHNKIYPFIESYYQPIFYCYPGIKWRIMIREVKMDLSGHGGFVLFGNDVLGFWDNSFTEITPENFLNEITLQLYHHYIQLYDERLEASGL